MDINKPNDFFWISLLFSTALTLCISQCTSKKTQPSIVGDWQITEMASVAGEIEKPPALTAYCFFKDSSYKFYYAPETKNAIDYSGTYAVSNTVQTLITDYTFNNNKIRDTAYILLLTDSLLILKENREKGDTIKFKRMTEALSTQMQKAGH